jgi:hypothetical protein
MKPGSCGILSLAAILVALHAPVGAQSRLAQDYLEGLKNTEKAVAQLPPEAYGKARDPELNKPVLSFSGPLQQLGTARAFAGDSDGAIAAFDILTRTRNPVRPAEVKQMSLVEDAVAEDAIKAIVEEARSRRVVLLNEAHHVPMHRAFARKLAAELRKIGYGYLACETFSGDGDVPTSGSGQVTYRTGYYTRDPVFADFVNSALADKWKLISYEFQGKPAMDPKERIEQRELAQAQNLVDRIFAKDKNAKVFIFVGYGHLNKQPEGDSSTPLMMGEHLRRITRLDMLHVDQTVFYAHPDRADESPLYQALLDKYPAKEPFVLRSTDGSPPILKGLQGRIDMQVIFPRYAMRGSRPEWLATLAGREPRVIPAELLPASGRRAIRAHLVGGAADAVPADIVLVEAGKPAPKLMLPAGDYRYTYED